MCEPVEKTWKAAYAARTLSIVAVVISGLALIISFWQGWIAQKALDLATGKVRARLEIVGISPSEDKIPPGYKADALVAGETVRFESLDRLLALNPTITVRNVGTEPIESLRVETLFAAGFIDSTDRPTNPGLNPWVTEQFRRDDYELSGKLEPGQVASVSLVRGLVAQMMQAQNDARGDRLHVATFRIRCYAKTAGGAGFDATEDSGGLGMRFGWIPEGFPRDRCRELVETMRPNVEIR